jgi:hypothetical protein
MRGKKSALFSGACFVYLTVATGLTGSPWLLLSAIAAAVIFYLDIKQLEKRS